MTAPASSAPDVVAGLGFRHATPAAEIVALVERALAEAGVPTPRLLHFATAADRAGEDAIGAAAAHFGRPVVAVSVEALVAADAGVLTRSARIVASRRVGSVAEAAALAAAGAGATLLLRRIASPGATCALARHASSIAPLALRA